MRTPISAVATFAVAMTAAGCLPLEEERRPAPEILEKPAAIGAGFGAPGGALFLGDRYLSFTGTDRRINIIRKIGQGDWSAPRTIDERSIAGASLAVYDGYLYLVWFDQFGRFSSLRTRDGSTWTDRRTHDVAPPGGRPHGEPALVIYNGKLQAYYALGPNPDGDDALAWSRFGAIHQLVLEPDGWSFYGAFPGESRSVSAAVLGDDLVVAWNHRDLGSFRTKKWVARQGWTQTNVIAKAQEGQFIDAGTFPPTLIWSYRVTDGPDTGRIKFARTSNGVDFQHHATSLFLSEQRPFSFRVGDGLVEFAHVGDAPNKGVSHNSIPFR